MGSRGRRLVNVSTHSSVTKSTTSKLRHGPRRWPAAQGKVVRQIAKKSGPARRKGRNIEKRMAFHKEWVHYCAGNDIIYLYQRLIKFTGEKTRNVEPLQSRMSTGFSSRHLSSL